MTDDETKAEAYVVKFITPVMTVLAAPIRAFYLAIGHSEVAGWALLSIVGGGIGYLWVDMLRELNAPINEARVRDMEASLRERELRIVEKELEIGQDAGLLTWTLGELNWDTTLMQASMEFVPLPTTTKLIFGWHRRRGGGGGLETQPVTLDSSGGSVTVSFPFSAEWGSGEEMVISFTQETSTGRRVRWLGSGRVETTP